MCLWTCGVVAWCRCWWCSEEKRERQGRRYECAVVADGDWDGSGSLLRCLTVVEVADNGGYGGGRWSESEKSKGE